MTHKYNVCVSPAEPPRGTLTHHGTGQLRGYGSNPPVAVVSSPSRSSSGRGPTRDGRGQQRPQPAVDEMGGDFAKELLEYRRMQRQRRRSYSRSVHTLPPACPPSSPMCLA